MIDPHQDSEERVRVGEALRRHAKSEFSQTWGNSCWWLARFWSWLIPDAVALRRPDRALAHQWIAPPPSYHLSTSDSSRSSVAITASRSSANFERAKFNSISSSSAVAPLDLSSACSSIK